MNRRPKTVHFWYGNLPHWEVEEGRYFITLHVAGAIPQAAGSQIRASVKQLQESETNETPDWLRIQRFIFGMMENWLDRAHYNAWLAEPLMAEMLEEAIETRQRRGAWVVHASVTMPNHVHLFAEIPSGRLKPTMEDFKRWTGHQATKIMKHPPQRFWQKEWFDHWSRSDQQDDRILRYIENNPSKAGLGEEYRRRPYTIGPESSRWLR